MFQLKYVISKILRRKLKNDKNTLDMFSEQTVLLNDKLTLDTLCD